MYRGGHHKYNGKTRVVIVAFFYLCYPERSLVGGDEGLRKSPLSVKPGEFVELSTYPGEFRSGTRAHFGGEGCVDAGYIYYHFMNVLRNPIT
jgi:hypothetical protein